MGNREWFLTRVRGGEAVRTPGFKVGWGVVVEPDEFVPFVLGEAVLVEEVKGILPLAMNAKVEDAHA